MSLSNILGYDSASSTELTTDNKVLNIGQIDSNLSAIVWKPGGQVLYVSGETSDTIFEYNLSVAYDISTADFNSSVYLGDLDGTGDYSLELRSFVFSSDGTNLFVFSILEMFVWDLSTPWDLSTLSYNLRFDSGYSSEYYVKDAHLTNGDRDLFVTGQINNRIERWRLCTYGDIGFLGDGTDLTSTVNSSTTVAWASDGNSYFYHDGSSTIYQYNLTDTYTGTTGTLVGSVAEPHSACTGIHVSDDGFKLYIARKQSGIGIVYTGTMTTANDITTLTWDSGFDLAPVATPDTMSFIYDLHIGNNGTKFYVMEEGSDLFEFDLSTPYDITTASFSGLYSFSTVLDHFTIDSTGTKILISAPGSYTQQYRMTTPFDISTVIYESFSQVESYWALSLSVDDKHLLTMGYSPDQYITSYSPQEWRRKLVQYFPPRSDYGDVSTASNPDGEGIVLDSTGTYLYQYFDSTDGGNILKLPSPFDLTGSAIEVIGKFNIGNVDSLEINDDGDKLLALNNTSGKITEYDIANEIGPFDTSGTTKYGELSVPATDAYFEAFTFNNNGSKIYLVTTNDIVELSAPTPYDISTINNNAPTFTLDQTGGNVDIDFNSTGTELYTVYSTAIKQYSLSSAFDLSTASFTDSFSVGIGLSSIVITSNKVYVGSTDYRLRVYDFGTPGDITTLTNMQEYSLTAETTSINKIRFNSNGTELYVVSESPNDALYRYDLSTAYDISDSSRTVSGVFYFTTSDSTGLEFANNNMYVSDGYNITTFDVTSQRNMYTALFDENSRAVIGLGNGSNTGLIFSNSGNSLYLTSSSTDEIYQYDLSVAYDISTAKYTNKNLDLSGTVASSRNIYLVNSGTRLLVHCVSNRRMYQYTLSTAYDISTATYDNISADLSSSGAQIGVVFNSAGSKMYVLTSTETLESYTTSGFSMASVSKDAGSQDLSGNIDTPLGFAASDDGLFLYISSSNKMQIVELSSAFDVSTLVTVTDFAISSASIYGIALNPSATSEFDFYVSELNTDEIRHYINSSGTPTLNKTLEVYWGDESRQSAVWNSDGTKMFIVYGGNIRQYSLSTAYDISTAVYDNVTLDANSLLDRSVNSPFFYASSFGDSGSKLYLCDHRDDAIFQLDLTTPYDISTASYNNIRWNHPSGSPFGDVYGITFNNNGTKMIISEYDQSISRFILRQYNLLTAWIISEAVPTNITITNNFSLESPQWNSTGTKLYAYYKTSSTASSKLIEYTTVSAYDAEQLVENTDVYLIESSFFVRSLSLSNDDSKFLVMTTSQLLATHSLTDFYLDPLGTNMVVPAVSDSPEGFFIKPDGTKIFVNQSYYVFEYDLTTPWDVTTMLFKGKFFEMPSLLGRGFTMSTNGDKFFRVTSDRILRQYDLSTAWDISTASLSVSESLYNVPTTTPQLTFNQTGDKLFVTEGGIAYTFGLSQPFDLSGGISLLETTTTVNLFNLMDHIAFNPSGTTLYVINATNTTSALVVTYLTAPYDLPTTLYNHTQNTNIRNSAGSITTPNSIFVSPGQPYIYIGTSSGEINQYTLLSNGQDIQENSIQKNLFTAYNDDITSLNISSDGKKIFSLGFGGDIGALSLGTAFDIDTASAAVSATLDTGVAIYDFCFNSSGTKLYYAASDNSIYQYDVPSAFDISLLTNKKQLSLSISPIAITVQISNDGRKLLVANSYLIFEYALNTAFDITTASLTSTINQSTRIIRFNGFGDRLFVSENSTTPARPLSIYSLDTPFDISTATKIGTFTAPIEQPFDMTMQNSVFTVNNNLTKFYVKIAGVVKQYSMVEPRPEIRPLTSVELDSLSYDVLEYLATLDQQTGNIELTDDPNVTNTVIGTYVDTDVGTTAATATVAYDSDSQQDDGTGYIRNFFSERSSAVNTFTWTDRTVSSTDIYYVSQQEYASLPTTPDLPLEYVINGTEVALQTKTTGQSLYEDIADICIENMLGTDRDDCGPNSYVFGSPPGDGGTWELAHSITDTVTSSSGDQSYTTTIYRKTGQQSKGTYPTPVKFVNNEITLFSQTDIQEIAKYVRQRIFSTGKGSYEITTNGSPPATGSWQNMGSISDTKYQLDELFPYFATYISQQGFAQTLHYNAISSFGDGGPSYERETALVYVLGPTQFLGFPFGNFLGTRNYYSSISYRGTTGFSTNYTRDVIDYVRTAEDAGPGFLGPNITSNYISVRTYTLWRKYS